MKTAGRWGLALGCWLISTLSGWAIEFSEQPLAGQKVTVCRVDVRRERLRLFLHDAEGRPLKSFATIEQLLRPSGQKLIFGMNAGMYHANFAPVGLFVSAGQQLSPVNLAPGDGNFFLKPNGVFLLTASGARIVESSEYPKLTEPVLLATQSGPLLVRQGRLHPAFKEGSTSRLFRNGVGVPEPGIAIFAITEGPVNFHEFATFFRDTLHCPDALFLDGTISSLYAPSLQRNDQKMDLGPIIGLTE